MASVAVEAAASTCIAKTFFSNGIQGGIAPVSAGLACAHKYGETGGIAVVFLGDGTLGQGAVYESLNIASKWNLPVLFICENNLYAQSTNQEQTLAGSITDRAKAFGVRTAHSDTWNWPQLFEGIENSVEMVRANSQPIFHQVDTYRLMAHSKGDDDRPSEEVEPYWEKDPIEQLKKQYAGDPGWAKMLEEIQAEIDEAVSQSEASDFGNVQVIDTAPSSNALEWQEPTFEKQRIVAGVRQGLENALNGNENVFLIGEDIESPYGGAFKCTLGLSDRFPGRVRNTPISEATIVGMGNGMAIKGMIPIVELMFGDFLALAADQWINHAAKFSWMYNDQVKMPVILRTPMGGKRGYAATHSQSIEKHFLGLPGTQVLCLHHRMCPTRLYDSLLANIDRPTLVIENKILYGHWADAQPPAGFQLLHTRESFPTANLKPQGTADLTIVSVGGMSRDVEEAAMDLFQNEEIAADLFMPTRLYPFDVACLEQSLSKTGRLLVVEEGQGFVSMSSEVLAQVAERFGHMNITPRRLAAAPVPIPASRPMEEQCLPGKQAVIGGGYLRLFPLSLIRYGYRQNHDAGRPGMSYIHPRETDVDRPRMKLPWKKYFKYYVGLSSCEAKLRQILKTFEFTTVSNVIAQQRKWPEYRLKGNEIESCDLIRT